MKQPEWKTYEPMVCKLAWSWHRTTGVSVEELISIGRTEFVKALHSFDSSKGASFSTWLYGACRLAMRRFIEAELRRGRAAGEEDRVLPEPTTQPEALRKLIMEEWIAELSEEARFVIRLLTEAPLEALGIFGGEPPKMIRGQIVRRLKSLGWSQSRRWGALRELKEAIAELP